MSKRCLKVRYEGPRWRRLLTNISIFMKYQDGRKLIPFTSPASHPSPENLAYAPSSYFLAPCLNPRLCLECHSDHDGYSSTLIKVLHGTGIDVRYFDKLMVMLIAVPQYPH